MQHVSTLGDLWIGDTNDAMVFNNPPDEWFDRHIPGFDLVWNLAAELRFQAEYEGKWGAKVLWANIPDYSSPPDPEAFIVQLQEVAAALKAGNRVFTHCFGGRGRT